MTRDKKSLRCLRLYNFVDDLCAILDMAIVDGVGLLLREIFGENTGKNLKRLRA